MTETTHEPDWPDELVKGEKLAECIVDLLDGHSPEEVAPVLGYCYMDEKGHDQPLVGHLMKAIEEAGVDLDEDEMDTKDMIEIWKDDLIQSIDMMGMKVWLPKKLYDENPQEYDRACDWKEIEQDEDEDNEPMMIGDLTLMSYIGKDMEYGEAFDEGDKFEYYEIPSKGIHLTSVYG